MPAMTFTEDQANRFLYIIGAYANDMYDLIEAVRKENDNEELPTDISELVAENAITMMKLAVAVHINID